MPFNPLFCTGAARHPVRSCFISGAEGVQSGEFAGVAARLQSMSAVEGLLRVANRTSAPAQSDIPMLKLSPFTRDGGAQVCCQSLCVEFVLLVKRFKCMHDAGRLPMHVLKATLLHNVNSLSRLLRIGCENRSWQGLAAVHHEDSRLAHGHLHRRNKALPRNAEMKSKQIPGDSVVEASDAPGWLLVMQAADLQSPRNLQDMLRHVERSCQQATCHVCNTRC